MVKVKAPVATGAPGPRAGRRTKVIDGKKWCRAHQKHHPVDEFPTASASCREGKRSIQNIAGAARAAGKKDWWYDTFNDDMKLKEAVRYYEATCAVKVAGTGKKKKPKTFPVVLYIEEKKESQSCHDERLGARGAR